MQSIKERIPVVLAVIIFLAVCALGYYLIMVHSTDYFTQIDNSKVEQLTNNEYEYDLTAYDEHGKMREVSFKANKKLRESALLKLKVMAIRGVVYWEEIEYNELPQDVQPRYQNTTEN